MKKLIWGLAIVVVVAVFGGRAWYLHKQAAAEKNVVKIGAILPLSGVYSEQGELALKAVLLAAEDFNKNSPFNIKVVAEDGKYTAKDTVSAYRKLRSSNVDLIWMWGSEAPMLAIAPIAAEENIPLYVSGWKSVDPGMTFWRYIPNYFKAFSSFVIDDLKSKNVVMFYIKDPTQEEIANGIEKHLAENNIPTLLKERVPLGTCKSLAPSLVDKALAKEPDTVVMQTFGPCLKELINTFRERRFMGPIVVPPDIDEYNQNLVRVDAPLYYVDSAFDEYSQDPKVQEFIQRFKAKYNKVPKLTNMESYMAIMMIAQSVPSADYKVMDVYQNMQNIHDFPSLLGPVTNVKEDRFLTFPWVIKQMMSDGTAKVVKE